MSGSGLVHIFANHLRMLDVERIDKLPVLLLSPLHVFRVLLQSLPPVVLALLLVDRLLHRAHRFLLLNLNLLNGRGHASLLARGRSYQGRGSPLLETNVLMLRFELLRLPLHDLPLLLGLLNLEPLTLLSCHLLLNLLYLLRGQHLLLLLLLLGLLLVVHLLVRVKLLLLWRLLGISLLWRRLLEGKRLVGKQMVDHRR